MCVSVHLCVFVCVCDFQLDPPSYQRLDGKFKQSAQFTARSHRETKRTKMVRLGFGFVCVCVCVCVLCVNGLFLFLFLFCVRLIELNKMKASDELDDEQIRQMTFDLENAYADFVKSLQKS